MLRIEETHAFPVAREAAFDYLTDIRSWPEYWPGFVRIRDPAHARWANPGDP
ncbi:MAG: hypothetical protein ACRDH0_10350 [Actinomycetota bacterium]